MPIQLQEYPVGVSRVKGKFTLADVPIWNARGWDGYKLLKALRGKELTEQIVQMQGARIAAFELCDELKIENVERIEKSRSIYELAHDVQQLLLDKWAGMKFTNYCEEENEWYTITIREENQTEEYETQFMFIAVTFHDDKVDYELSTHRMKHNLFESYLS